MSTADKASPPAADSGRIIEAIEHAGARVLMLETDGSIVAARRVGFVAFSFGLHVDLESPKAPPAADGFLFPVALCRTVDLDGVTVVAVGRVADLIEEDAERRAEARAALEEVAS